MIELMTNGEKRQVNLEEGDADQKLSLLLEETVRQRAMISQRASAFQSRAALLVGASTLIGTIQAVEDASALSIVAMTLTLVAVIFGVIALLPKLGIEVGVGKLRGSLGDRTPRQLLTELVDQNLNTEKAEQEQMSKVGCQLRIGFSFLAAGVLFTALASII